MAKFSRSAASIAVVAVPLLIVVSLPVDSASADDNCATAPSTAPPEGQHWYYRTDRVKQRKCWYLHATMPLPSHAAADPPAAPSESVSPVATPQSPSAVPPQATNAVSPPQQAADTSNPPNKAASAPPAPHITVLTVKTVTAPFGGTASASQSVTPEQTGEPPTPQISPGDTNVPVDGNTGPASRADPAAVPAAPGTAHEAAPDAAGTQSAHLFFLLALALGIAAALIALVGKMAGRTRMPRLSDHPDDAWRSYRVALQRGDETFVREDAPFLAPEEPSGPADLDAREWIEQSPPAQADFPEAWPKDEEPGRSEPAGPTLKDIELALRILRQARGSITRT